MGSKTILLVDDEESILISSRKDFEHAGYEVTTAASGEEAVTNLQADHFDLVVTDLAMPGIDGLAVLLEAKKHSPEIGTIILTGYGDMISAIEALRLGADDYLLKPCDSDELLLRAARCLERQEVLQKIKIYEEMLPVCCVCGDIRDDTGEEKGNGVWMKSTEFIIKKTSTQVTHTYCKDCIRKQYPDIADEIIA